MNQMIIEKRIRYVNLFWSDFPQTPKHIYQLVHLDETRPDFFLCASNSSSLREAFPFGKRSIHSIIQRKGISGVSWMAFLVALLLYLEVLLNQSLGPHCSPPAHEEIVCHSGWVLCFPAPRKLFNIQKSVIKTESITCNELK